MRLDITQMEGRTKPCSSGFSSLESRRSHYKLYNRDNDIFNRIAYDGDAGVKMK